MAVRKRNNDRVAFMECSNLPHSVVIDGFDLTLIDTLTFEEFAGCMTTHLMYSCSILV